MHDFEIRPWGEWHVLDEGDGFKVKRIQVNPGQRLSYQTHEHRAENWVVAAGTCTAVIDGETVVATAGQSIYVEIGQAHRPSEPIRPAGSRARPRAGPVGRLAGHLTFTRR